MTEEQHEIAPGITVDRPDGFGKPVVRGAGVEVSSILQRLAAGATFEALERECGVSREGILAAIAYAAEIVAEEPAARAHVEEDAPYEVGPGVTKHPTVRFGKPVLKGTRMDVASVLGYLAAGDSIESLAAEHGLSVEAVRNAVQYGYKIVSSEKVSAP